MASVRSPSARVTKGTWYRNGGFSNPRCWRRQVGAAWHYYIRVGA